MKQLTKEQQEQAVELIERSIHEKDINFIESAKGFLQSLKPKYYIGCLDGREMFFLSDTESDCWTYYFESALFFYSLDDARKVLNNIEKYEDKKYFILTE